MAQLEGMQRAFVDAAMRAPFLERADEQRLARAARDGDKRALHRLTEAHMRLVISMASRYRRYGLPVSDLVQEGHIGLMEAAARFDPDREVRFSTYATWWIRASIQDFVLRNWSIVRGGTSSGQKALFFNLRRVRARLAHTSAFSRPGTMHAAIAEAMGVSRADVELMDARLSGPDISLNAPLGDREDDATREDFLVDSRPLADEVVGETMEGTRRSADLARALSTLNPRELRILRDRKLAEEAATLEELGASLGISKERVRQIESKALDKLRRVLTAA